MFKNWTNFIRHIPYFNHLFQLKGWHTPFDGGVGICIRTLTHSAITFLMDFIWYILFLYLVGKTGTPFILYFHTPPYPYTEDSTG